jgi:hypothetical protein
VKYVKRKEKNETTKDAKIALKQVYVECAEKSPVTKHVESVPSILIPGVMNFYWLENVTIVVLEILFQKHVANLV